MSMSAKRRNLTFSIFLGPALILFSGLKAHSDGTSPRVIKISAKKFEFTPNSIELKKGEAVVLELSTTDRKHGFKVKSLDIDALIKPGEITRVALTPDKAGEFSFHCSSFCGSKHEEMIGKIIVKE
jgi:cytochrome c oxidase subunit 2